LTPRVWTGLFAADPLRSDLDRVAGLEIPMLCVDNGAG
jgi:hypothetical protein